MIAVARKLLTQHTCKISQYWGWVIIPDDKDEQADVDDIVFSNEIVRNGRENVKCLQGEFGGQPLLRRELLVRYVKAIKMS